MAPLVRVASLPDVAAFRAHLAALGLELPCDDQAAVGDPSPLLRPLHAGTLSMGNRLTAHPMEGWDATADGRPSEHTLRRWARFGRSGAKLIWGGEAVAVRSDGRANPHQLVINEENRDGLAHLREVLCDAHREATGSTDGLVIGLQLTHSGRYSRPREETRAEPVIAHRHPILDRRLGLAPDYPLVSDGELRAIIEAFVAAARLARSIGFDFVDVKHCHGYLAHELLGARERPGAFGGSFENRTRFLRDVVAGIRSQAPGLEIGVRLSAFDTIPFRPDPQRSQPGRPGPGIPEPFESLLPYRWGFGVAAEDPRLPDLAETIQFLELLRALGVRLVNLTAGSPYYNPHIQRPALFPPSDGYQPPEDPLVGVARQMTAVRRLKQLFPDLALVGTGYTYLQEYLPHVAQAAVREGWVDSVGVGRMLLAYPEYLWQALHGEPVDRSRLCRTFSDCTTAPRNGLISGCYPLDLHYRQSETGEALRLLKAQAAPSPPPKEAPDAAQ